MDMQTSHDKVSSFVGETFDPHVSETFRVQPVDSDGNVEDSGSVALELVSVSRFPKIKEIEGSTDHRIREPFSLLFLGSHDTPLISGIHYVQHDQLGSFHMSLNPVQIAGTTPPESHPDGRFYEAVFG